MLPPHPAIIPRNASDKGFTLIELSIVLVIIGLIVGGILVGQNLIASAAIRAQITQIQKYNQAANTFYGKYGYLPGDIPALPAAQFGFASRGSYTGEGDGNGIIQGVSSNLPGNACGGCVTIGEQAMFWVDLSTANMIEGGFNTASSTVMPSSNVSPTGVASYMPPAKIGRGNYLFVYSDTNGAGGGVVATNSNNFNLVGMSGIIEWGPPQSYPALSVHEAYSIDKKIDDGLPATGNVVTFYYTYVGGGVDDRYPAGGGTYGANPASLNAAPGSSTTCYDNAGNGGIEQYSMTQDNGANINCALSIRLQAGDQ